MAVLLCECNLSFSLLDDKDIVMHTAAKRHIIVRIKNENGRSFGGVHILPVGRYVIYGNTRTLKIDRRSKLIKPTHIALKCFRIAIRSLSNSNIRNTDSSKKRSQEISAFLLC